MAGRGERAAGVRRAAGKRAGVSRDEWRTSEQTGQVGERPAGRRAVGRWAGEGYFWNPSAASALDNRLVCLCGQAGPQPSS